ncbi:MAG: thiamine pyrophosphate-requiring protein [Candidatus Melainabacteria bacterium]|nr:thiamine pyrophosphate-requiring protein [Candidatus Melainabacteria bacterium]
MTSILKGKCVQEEDMMELSSGARIFYRRQGDGDELILFLHAVGGDHSSFSPQMDRFSGRYCCVSFDMRGHGRSTLPQGAAPEVSCTVDNFAADAIELIDRLQFKRAHLVGLSMGGVVALACFAKRPDLIQSLTIANTWAHVDDAASRIAFIEEQLKSKTMSESAAELIPGLFAPGFSDPVVEAAVKVEGSKDKDVFLASWRSMFSVDLRDFLPLIDVPLTLIGGSEDRVTPTSPLLTEIFANTSTSRLVEIAGAGHFSNLDHVVDFNRYLAINLRRGRGNGLTRSFPAVNAAVPVEGETVAHALLGLLDRRGVDFFFSNSGTDFTPIIDAFAFNKDREGFSLAPVVAPHENTAIAMAHGYFLLSGRPQAVMAHVNVGTANMGLGIINASRSRIPVLVLAGNTPWYDGDIEGCRTNFVQWGQDTFDQASYFREFTKWDYQLKGPHDLDVVVDRALAIAQSDPGGPVYLTLPKEPLSMPWPSGSVTSAGARQNPVFLSAAAPEAVARAAEVLASARKPLVVTAELGRYPGGPEALVLLAQRYAIPVVEHGKRNFFNFPTENEMHQGFEPSPLVEDADVIIAVETHVPYIPALSGVKKAPTIIQIGVDPLCSNLPMRAFPVDIGLAGNPALNLKALTRALACLGASERYGSSTFYGGIAERCKELARMHKDRFESAREKAGREGGSGAITKSFLSFCIGRAIDDDVVIFNEYNLDPLLVPRRCPDSWFENSIASGLGWSLGAALGGALASPDEIMMVTLGDGSYLFNTPLSAHCVAASYNLPVVIVVFNDSAWSTIKKSYKGTMPDGWAVRKDHMPLCDFDIDVSFEKLAEATGGVGIKVDDPGNLEESLRAAVAIARNDRKHVLVNVVCQRDG